MMCCLRTLYFVGPIFCEDVVYVTFDYGKGLKSSDGGPLRTFEVAETDGVYYPAVAEIINGQIKVYSEQVKRPRYIRYGWQPFTRANLVNEAGLPASTFRAEAPESFCCRSPFTKNGGIS